MKIKKHAHIAPSVHVIAALRGAAVRSLEASRASEAEGYTLCALRELRSAWSLMEAARLLEDGGQISVAQIDNAE